jgi:hypothetical protein
LRPGGRIVNFSSSVVGLALVETVELCLQPLKGFGALTAALKQLFGSRDLRARSRRRVAPGRIACRQAQHKNIYESTKEVGDDHNLNKSQHRYL